MLRFEPPGINCKVSSIIYRDPEAAEREVGKLVHVMPGTSLTRKERCTLKRIKVSRPLGKGTVKPLEARGLSLEDISL